MEPPAGDVHKDHRCCGVAPDRVARHPGNPARALLEFASGAPSICGFASTEPGCGTGMAAMSTTFERVDGGYRIRRQEQLAGFQHHRRLVAGECEERRLRSGVWIFRVAPCRRIHDGRALSSDRYEAIGLWAQRGRRDSVGTPPARRARPRPQCHAGTARTAELDDGRTGRRFPASHQPGGSRLRRPATPRAGVPSPTSASCNTGSVRSSPPQRSARRSCATWRPKWTCGRI